ncbi:hypothetical protein DFH09DRAFT_1076806 [Mycena vulgaris]|nr:hypothetical protein DFH09DRAFT_1076806 [Mycena vulgaris]
MAQHPAHPFLVFADYTRRGRVGVATLSKDTFPATLEFEADLPTQCARLAHAGGWMEMHVMLICDFGIPRPRLFPLRFTSSKLYDELRSIARAIPFGERMTEVSDLPPAVGQKLRALLRDTDLDEMYVEIH